MVSEEQNNLEKSESEDIPVPTLHQNQEEILEKEKEKKNDQNKTLKADSTENASLTDNVLNVHKKKPRQRKKALHAAILKQMEFYFSDANLRKDRFIASLIKENPNIDIEVFLKFNRIIGLTTDAEIIAKALKNSSILRVSEDGKTVCRITPIQEKPDVEECTIYVQRLPPDIDHDSLNNIFSEYGAITYISIPKFKITKRPKGFAFVEFENIESAKKCLEDFRAKGFEIPSQTAPHDLLSISTFNEEQNENHKHDNDKGRTKIEHSEEPNLEKGKEKKKRKRSRSMERDTSNKEYCEVPDSSQEKSMKKNTDGNLCDNIPRKKIKINTYTEDVTEARSTEDLKDIQNNPYSDQSEIKEENEIDKKAKKNRKRKYRTSYDNFDVAFIGIQVMSKTDWKKLRNKYLNLQREKMCQLKQYLSKNRRCQYKRPKTDVEKPESNPKEKPELKLSYIPGVIVKIEYLTPWTDLKSIKNEMRSNLGVQYVDATENSSIAFVRCDASENAMALLEKNDKDRKFSILVGEEEKCYWEKIKESRAEKINNKVRVKQRGRDKLTKKAEKMLGKHIRFEEV